jgi:hypothetical protein
MFFAVVLAVCVVAIFEFPTPIISLIHKKSSAEKLLASLIASWLLKMLVLIIAFLILQNVDFFNHLVFGLFIIAGAIVTVIVEVVVIKTARIPYV